MGHARRRLFILASLLLLVLVPTADTAAFGLHEHVVVAADPGVGLGGADRTQDPTSLHHCELSVSIGELLPIMVLPRPAGVMADQASPHEPTVQHKPFLPLIPPRA